MLVLNEIAKAYGKKPVLEGVNLNLEKGNMLCLSGPSGMGKSTLLRIAAGIEPPDGGRVEDHASQKGFAFQETVLLPWKSVAGNLRFVIGPGEKKENKIKTLLAALGLAEAADLMPRQLSGGMKKLVGLAISLAVDPDLLFLDEPFAFVDRMWQDRITRYLLRLNREKKLTIFMASHELDPVRAMGARILNIQGTPIRICHI
jgi:ABC-type nitrate/sulfonate/bicarbonate transport system ATPase subunit